jgi:uncharacterized membrane protein YdfJ with MMPL/SSD domain
LARFLLALGTFVAHRKWVVVGAWALAAIVLVVCVHQFGSNTTDNVSLPGTLHGPVLVAKQRVKPER